VERLAQWCGTTYPVVWNDLPSGVVQLGQWCVSACPNACDRHEHWWNPGNNFNPAQVYMFYM